ncbi:MAG: threonine-phosphate decarboxylase CobD [Candidatus Omnitrophota bacterium]|nr:threonine-phosphate decarboxylase CobD [Candidatus Omnitrophota bacterium]
MIDRIHGGIIWPYLKAGGCSSKDKVINGERSRTIDFSVNINPLGLPPRVKETILKNIGALLRYPDPDSKGLKSVISAFYDINQNNILVGNGSIELIHLIPRALKARNALIVGPTFSEYEFAVRSNGTKAFFAQAQEQDDFRIGLLKIKKSIPKADLIFLCNPNNPTGYLMPKNELLDIFYICKRYNTTLVIDEAFIDFLQNNKKITLVTEAAKYNRLLVIRSLTKFFALPGLRLGYLVGQRRIVEHLSKFQYPWNVNSLAQAIAGDVFKAAEYIKLSRNFIAREKGYLFENLSQIKGLKVYRPAANFVFCKLESCKIRDSIRLNNRLRKNGIIIRGCHNFRGLDNRFFRIAVRTRSENKRLIACLKKVLL